MAMEMMEPTESTQYSFTVTSSSLRDGEFIPDKHVYQGMGCHGENLSPELKWGGAPVDTKSFAITCFDPDAPADGWWHWTVVNIPNNVNELKEGASNHGFLPRGCMEVWNDFEEKGYGGPCPPRGDKAHRYIFTVYALEVDSIYADAMETGQTLKNELEKKALAKTTLTVKYQCP